ncbi:MFS transporter [Desmospora profundinema]|uniref:MFS family permease n=1 Tax=Desmospora profundinema TaxID=1571184 RepID=A0ABU1IHP1_9BACL|nr:MFS transporter [Desmospora profundinema]MDR6224062.1 MFS family permease [Desmospora profundinema]
MYHSKAREQINIGLKENLTLFALLVVVNLFVGSMIGLERTVLPLLGEKVFGLASASAALSFIVSFGFTKAIVNILAGRMADWIGRKQVLIAGWFVGLFVPLIVIWADSWWWIVIANILLGINQGLTWSMTVNMKVDLVTAKQRGLAIGLNEFAGYIGVALATVLSAYIASQYHLRPEPFYLGIGFVGIGLILSLMVTDTGSHLKLQSRQQNQTESNQQMSTRNVFRRASWKDPTLSNCSFAGLSTNLKDGMAWGLFPLFFASAGLAIGQIGIIVALYPAAWGIFQLFTGALSDRIGRKWLIASGMWLQALSIWWILFLDSFVSWVIGAILLGLGTAMVYPTLQAAISDVSPPEWRASALGVYRFWRDSGYAFGALIAGILVDVLNISWAIGLVALLPLLAGITTVFRMKETLKT